MTARSFERKYVYRTRHLLRLRKPPEAQCHFLCEKGCTIHPVKPAQCRAFPFWPESVESPRAWRELRSYCPGVGKGDIVPLTAVQRIANDMRESYPGMYPVKAGGS